MDSVKIANQQLPLFQGIQPAQTAAMLNCLHGYTQKYNKNDLISLSEQSSETNLPPEQRDMGKIGIVLSGTLHVYQEDLWGNRSLLNYLGPGELFGESLILQNGHDSHLSFISASKCEILFLSGCNVLHPCHHNCPFHRRMIENLFLILSLKNQRLMEQIEIASQKTLRDKILAYLSREAQINQSLSFTIPLNRTQLADYLCANRSALYRELTTMEEEGLITADGRQFTLYVDNIPVN